MHKQYFSIAFGESRLLGYAPRLSVVRPEDDGQERKAEAVRDVRAENEGILGKKGGSKAQKRGEIREKFDQDKDAARNRIKDANGSNILIRKLGWTEEHFVDKELDRIARERAKEAMATIGDIGQRADAAILDRAAADSNSLFVLEQKIAVCKEVIGDLEAEIAELDADREQYLAAAKLLGQQKEAIDSPRMQKTKDTLGKVQQAKRDAERATNAARNQRGVQEIERMHSTLFSLLQKASPGYPGIERMIMDNVGNKEGGTKRSELVQFINDLQKDDKINKNQRDILLGMADKLRLNTWFGKQNRSNIAAYYSGLLSKSVATQSMSTKELLEHVFKQVPAGKTLVVGRGMAASTMTILKKEHVEMENGKSKNVVRLLTREGQDAVLDPEAGILSIEQGDGTYKHVKLEARKAQNGDDLSALQFSGKSLGSLAKSVTTEKKDAKTRNRLTDNETPLGTAA